MGDVYLPRDKQGFDKSGYNMGIIQGRLEIHLLNKHIIKRCSTDKMLTSYFAFCEQYFCELSFCSWNCKLFRISDKE